MSRVKIGESFARGYLPRLPRSLSRSGVVLGTAVAVALLLSPLVGRAEPHDDRGHEHERYDARHGHNRYYPEHGARITALPREAHVVVWNGEHLWYHDGVWYRPHGHHYIVIAPPVGVFVPVVPAFATLVVLGRVQYYYANEAYYRYLPERGGYVIVVPPGYPAGPPGPVAPASAAAVPPAPAGPPAAPPAPAPSQGSDATFAYPRNGQSADDQARDRYECHRWAADQTGFDPTRPAGGVAAEVVATKRADYQRAEQACLEARGYTVR